MDATFGRGGHSLLILQRLASHGRLIAIDRDPEAVAAAHEIRDPRFTPVHAPFSELGVTLAALCAGGVDGVLFDLGVSSPQLDDMQRGFSFRFDAPLDMRMDPTRGTSAAEWLERADEAEIREVLSAMAKNGLLNRLQRRLLLLGEEGLSGGPGNLPLSWLRPSGRVNRGRIRRRDVSSYTDSRQSGA